MNRIMCLLIGLCCLLEARGQNAGAEYLPPPEPEEREVFFLTGNDGWGNVPRGWERQQEMLKGATDADLESMALHAEGPADRAAAFHALATKHSDRCNGVILNSLSDTASFYVASFDIWYPMRVSSFMLEWAEQDSLIISQEQRYHLDSLIVFTHGLGHLDKYPSAVRLKGEEGVYERVRELYLEGDSNLLPLIEEYNYANDVSLVIDALKEYGKGLDPEGRSVGRKGRTNEALEAIVRRQDDAFIPALEELRDFELSRNYLDYYRIKMLFKAVMAYDNDWAFHFIEDMFENRGADKKFSYPDNFYRAYHEENGPKRFLPLVERYGERHAYLFITEEREDSLKEN